MLLILRCKDGQEYATLPGGGIEGNETPAQACAREMLEEVNLTVMVGHQLAELPNLQNYEHYFLTTLAAGSDHMRLGDGPESLRNSERNSYSPQWVNVGELEAVNLLPEQARHIIREVHKI